MATGPRDRVVPHQIHVFVCHWGKVCPTKGSQELTGLLRDMLAARGMQDKVIVSKSGCLELCDIGPNIVIYPGDVWYSNVRPADLEEIVQSHLIGGKPVERLRSPKAADPASDAQQ